MLDTEITRFRQRLIELRSELQAAAVASAASSEIVELDQSKVGRLSRMDAMQAQAMALASSQRRQHMLVSIEAALRRIDKKVYGLCQSCDGPIGIKRLEFDPTVRLCIGCASGAER